MKRIAVMVSGGGTNLQALLDSNLKYGEIVLVVSSNDHAYALERAKNYNIESSVIRRKDFDNQDDFDEAIIKCMREHQIDVIVLAGYLSILGKKVIKAYENRIINVHPSLIPSFCGKGFYGLKVHEAALAKGVKVSGATVHLVNEIPDGGKILLQKAVEVKKDDTPETLQKRIMEEAEWKLLPKAVDMVCEEIKDEEC